MHTAQLGLAVVDNRLRMHGLAGLRIVGDFSKAR